MLEKRGWLVIGHPQRRLREMLLVVTRNSALAHGQTHLTMETDLPTEGNLGNKCTQEVCRKWHANLRVFLLFFFFFWCKRFWKFLHHFSTRHIFHELFEVPLAWKRWHYHSWRKDRPFTSLGTICYLHFEKIHLAKLGGAVSHLFPIMWGYLPSVWNTSHELYALFPVGPQSPRG